MVQGEYLFAITCTFDQGQTEFRAEYDAWGRQNVVTDNLAHFQRGYCGHEHWHEFDLIDMNGRMYDPVIARFLSPDPFVQAPEDLQNYNRYSYCLNNPLKYVFKSCIFLYVKNKNALYKWTFTLCTRKRNVIATQYKF